MLKEKGTQQQEDKGKKYLYLMCSLDTFQDFSGRSIITSNFILKVMFFWKVRVRVVPLLVFSSYVWSRVRFLLLLR